MEFNFNSYDNSKQAISYCEVDKCKAVVKLQEQLDQLKEQLEAYKMEAEEGKEINTELKAENGYLKHKIFRYEEIFKHSADMTKNPVTAIDVETFQSSVKALGNSLIAEENIKLHKTLTEIKEIAEKRNYLDYNECLNDILQKISEVEDGFHS